MLWSFWFPCSRELALVCTHIKHLRQAVYFPPHFAFWTFTPLRSRSILMLGKQRLITLPQNPPSALHYDSYCSNLQLRDICRRSPLHQVTYAFFSLQSVDISENTRSLNLRVCYSLVSPPRHYLPTLGITSVLKARHIRRGHTTPS
jgi:hypothetical protein